MHPASIQNALGVLAVFIFGVLILIFAELILRGVGPLDRWYSSFSSGLALLLLFAMLPSPQGVPSVAHAPGQSGAQGFSRRCWPNITPHVVLQGAVAAPSIAVAGALGTTWSLLETHPNGFRSSQEGRAAALVHATQLQLPQPNEELRPQSSGTSSCVSPPMPTSG